MSDVPGVPDVPDVHVHHGVELHGVPAHGHARAHVHAHVHARKKRIHISPSAWIYNFSSSFLAVHLIKTKAFYIHKVIIASQVYSLSHEQTHTDTSAYALGQKSKAPHKVIVLTRLANYVCEFSTYGHTFPICVCKNLLHRRPVGETVHLRSPVLQ